jgi:phosphoglycerate kinase
MITGIKTLDDFDVKGKTVLLRVDINSPVNSAKRIKDDTRISSSISTIEELSEKGARTVVLAHQGDPMDYQNFTDLSEHASLLEQRLGKPVKYIDDVVGPAAREAIRSLENGQILLLENVRIHTEETIIFEKQSKLSPKQQADTILVRKLAPLADIYLCDAFACVHRSEPSLVGFPQVMPSGCGRLFEQEITVLNKVTENPKRPCVFILGGAKILDAFSMMESVLANNISDKVLTIGLVGNTMLRAAGHNLGAVNDEFMKKMDLDKFVEPAKKLLADYPDKVLYPSDVAIDVEGKRKEIPVSSLPADAPIKDIGSKTIEEFSRLISKAGTLFMNGPAGVYEDEQFSTGTKSIWTSVADSDGFSLIGGGDTIAASKKFGVDKKISYICTAGGGLVLFLSGKKLPVIEALKNN